MRHTTGASQAVQEISAIDPDSHAERNLINWFGRQPWSSLMPRPFEFEVHYQKKGGIGTYRSKTHVILPHEVFHSIFEASQELFHHLFVGGPGNLESWWRQTEATDPGWVQRHPVCIQTPASLRVPLGMHGDDAGLFEHEKVLVLSWNSVAVGHTTIDNRILFGTLAYSKVLGGVTLNEFYTVFVWSLNALSTGLFPEADHNGRRFDADYYPEKAKLAGNPIAGGFVGAWSEFRGRPK